MGTATNCRWGQKIARPLTHTDKPREHTHYTIAGNFMYILHGMTIKLSTSSNIYKTQTATKSKIDEPIFNVAESVFYYDCERW